jgi:hypothetical protein
MFPQTKEFEGFFIGMVIMKMYRISKMDTDKFRHTPKIFIKFSYIFI